MVIDIQAKEVIDKISQDLKIQPALQIPRKISEQIALVYNVNPNRMIQVKAISASDIGSSLIHTTHATKRTFLVALHLTTSKDIVSTAEFSTITGSPKDGIANSLLNIIRFEPLTAGQFVNSIELSQPIELAKATTITVTNSTAIASIDSTGIIYFYEVDPQ